MCIHVPRVSLRQAPGQSTLPSLQPGAGQTTVPTPLHWKQTFSFGPGPATTGGFDPEAEDCFAESVDFCSQPTNNRAAKKKPSTVQNENPLRSCESLATRGN